MIKNIWISIFFGLSLILTISAGLIGYVGLYDVQGPIIIHFNYTGVVDFIGGSGNVSNVVIVSFVILVINFLLAWNLYDRKAILSYILSFASVIIGGLTLMAVYLISSIN